MKKIILLLTVLTLGVIACDKNELGDMDSMSINPIEATVEAYDVDAIVNELLSNLSNHGKSKRGNASITGKGDDHVALHIFADTGVTYVIFADESNNDFCFDTLATAPTTIFFDNSAGDGSELSVEDAAGNVSIVLKGNFASFFLSGNNTLVKLDNDNKNDGQADFNDDNAVTFGS